MRRSRVHRQRQQDPSEAADGAGAHGDQGEHGEFAQDKCEQTLEESGYQKLKEEGVRFTILEKSPKLGGTWWENTYPGCGCDVPSHLYSFSFLPNPDWSRVYSGQAEILDYLKRVASKFNLVEHIQFSQRVTKCDWDPEACQWKISTEQGGKFTARVLVSGQGALHVPKTPDFPGADSFKGEMMHTAR